MVVSENADDADAPTEAELAAFIADLIVDDVPSGAIDTTVRAFVDTVGVAVAGTRTEVGRTAVPPEGTDADVSAAERALYLGTVGHALDYDDLSWGMDGHPSTVIVPPILAVAERRAVDGRDAVTAYVAGFEAACAVAEPISPAHYERGWHATSTFGVFGATAAAASLLDLDADRTRTALGIAASTPAGLKRNFGSMTKPLHAGFAARSGVTAARLAAAGATADGRAIGGERGFWDLYGDGAANPPSPSVGEGWYIESEGIHVKMYPCCYFAHTSVAATQDLRERHGVEPADIESIRVTASRGAADALQHSDPETGLEAKFSMEYLVASAAVRDRVGLGAFEADAVEDPAVKAVRRRVEFTADPDLEYDSHEATVVVETGADTFETTRTDPPGVHQNPPSESEMRAKFLECATRTVSEDVAESIYEDVASLPDRDDVSVPSVL